MILGLDISTSTIGYCIINNDGFLKRIGYIGISNIEDIVEKGYFVFQFFNNLLKEEKIEHIYIEDISQKFSPGFSSAGIITLLARFNGIVSFILYYITHIKPNYIMATSSRKKAYKMSFKRGIDIKKQIFIEVNKREKIPWLKTQKGKIKNECYDMCDSYTLSLCGYNILKDLSGNKS